MTDKKTETAALLSHTIIDDIMAKLDLPNGFSKLQPNQRKFLLGAVLGTIIPADGKIREVEMQHLEAHLKQKYNFNAETLKLALSYANTGLAAEQLKKAAKQLSELLSIEDRTSLIGLLWDIAICDEDLNCREEAMIYNIADSAGVPRKRVIEQQARVQANYGN